LNFFTDNEDAQFHFKEAVKWEAFVPLWEEGFRFEDGPRSLQEARELYETSLTEAGEFLAREIAPRARTIDEQGVSFQGGEVVHPKELLANIDGLKKMGLMAPTLPRELGGFNFPFTVSTFFVEALSRACTNTMILYAFHQGPAIMIRRFGNADQVERWVKPLAAGDISGAVAMTEPEAGSDVGALQTLAVPEQDHWRLTGRKQFITNGCGDVCIVLARSETGSKGLEGLSLFVVPRRENGKDNYRVAKPEKKFVIRGSATCELSFDGSCAELLGKRGEGFGGILTFMNEARVAVAVQALGISEAAYRAAHAYAQQRVQMGRPIARHEMVADMLFDMEAELAAMRALVYRCTATQDRIIGLERTRGTGAASEASTREWKQLRKALRDRTPLVKWFAAERALWIARTAVQIHGGYGVIQDYDVERHYRDALILPIYEGTSQIQALMSLKDQTQWGMAPPWRALVGPVSVEAPPGTLGEALREMAAEYNRAWRHSILESLGLSGILKLLVRRQPPDRDRLGYALLHAERLCLMLAYTRAAEELVAQASASTKRRRLAERFVHRALPLVRSNGDVVRSDDRSTLEALQA
jgi:alkylation response protein AidB-like acyl-CoA dehydrogenase